MKKFFKNLALVMALVLTIGSIPAQQAKAAEPTLAKTKKTIFVKQDDAIKYAALGYIGESYEKATRVSKYYKSFKLNINNLADDAKVSVKSSDRDVAFYSKNYNRIFARKAGKATFTVKVDGEKIGEIAVTVKANAHTVEITNIPEDNIIGFDGISLVVAQKDAKGNASNDKVAFKITAGDDVAAVDENGIVTVKKAGTFKVKALTNQSKTFTGITAESAEYELKAQANVLSAAQASDKVVNVTFDASMKDKVSAADFSVYTLIGDAKMAVAVKSAVADKDDSVIVALELWNSIAADQTYYIDYQGQVKEISGAKVNPEDVASIVILTEEAVEKEATEIKYKLLNKDGIEVTKAASAVVTFTTSNTDVSYITGDSVLFYEKDKQATIKVEYSYWYTDANGEWKEHTAEASALIKSVAVPAITVDKVNWTITKKTHNAGADTVDFTKAYTKVDFVAQGDTGYYIDLRMDLSDESVKREEDLTFKTSNASVVMIAADGYSLVPVNAGTANILVYQTADAKEPIAFIPVTVKAARVITAIEVTPSKTLLNVSDTSKIGGLADKVVVTTVLKDQYGQVIDGSVVMTVDGGSLKDVAAVTVTSTTAATSDGKATFNVPASNFGATSSANGSEGSLVLGFQDSSKKANVARVSITTKAVTDASGTVVTKLELSETELDARIDADTAVADLAYTTTISIVKTVSGYQVAPIADADAAPADNKWSDEVSDGDDDLYYDITFNGSLVTPASGSEFAALTQSGTDPIAKAKTGNYTVNLWRAYDADSTAEVKVAAQKLDSATFTVKDTQPGVIFTQKANKIASASDVTAAFEVKYDGNVVTIPASDFNITEGNGYVYVNYFEYKITRSVDPFNGKNLVIKVPVGKVLVVEP